MALFPRSTTELADMINILLHLLVARAFVDRLACPPNGLPPPLRNFSCDMLDGTSPHSTGWMCGSLLASMGPGGCCRAVLLAALCWLVVLLRCLAAPLFVVFARVVAFPVLVVSVCLLLLLSSPLLLLLLAVLLLLLLLVLSVLFCFSFLRRPPSSSP